MKTPKTKTKPNQQQPTVYQQLYNAYCKVNDSIPGPKCQQLFNEKWESIKQSPNSSEEAQAYLKELQNIISARRHGAGSILNAFSRARNKALSTLGSETATYPSPSTSTCDMNQMIEVEFHPDSSQFDEPTSEPEVEAVSSSSATNVSTTAAVKTVKTPAQDEVQLNLDIVNSHLVGLYKRKELDQLTEDDVVLLRKKKKEKETLEKKISNLKSRQKSQKNFRSARSIALKSAISDNPGLKEKLRLRGEQGRPRLEAQQPFLLETIVNLAMYGSAAEDKRRDDRYRSMMTLNDLKAALENDGFEVSRSALYTRLLPRRSNTNEGRRHVKTVPVKLIRAQNDLHNSHPDQHFAKATIRNVEQLASLLGPKEVFFLSQDDKARYIHK